MKLPSLSLLAGAAFLLCSAEAFTPPGLSQFQQKTISQTTRTQSLLSTATKEDRLTREDEEMLFGNGDSSSNQNNEEPNNPLDHAKDPLINKLRNIRQKANGCPELWGELARACPDKRAVLDEHMCDDTVDQNFAQFADTVSRSASVFSNLGVSKGNVVAIFGENSAKWLIADQGIQMAGGASAVRGADAPLDELRYIYEHSDSCGLAVLQGPKLLQKLAKEAGDGGLGLVNKFGSVKTILLLHREKKTDADILQMAKSLNVEVQVLGDLLDASSPIANPPALSREDLSTIVYTSGTTGRPKGVMLTQGNMLHQTGHRLAPETAYEDGEPLPGEMMLSLLPVWHITERTFELWMASRGCSIVYSSIRTFKKDLAKHKPQWLVLVPRVLEKIASGVQDKFANGSAPVKVLSNFFTKVGKFHAKNLKVVNGLVVADAEPGMLEKLSARVKLAAVAPLQAAGNILVWSKVQDGFGGRVKTVISGGSALAGGLETFYETAGLNICVGYGLTECSPLIAFRRSDGNLVSGGCAGRPAANTELRVVDPAASVGDSPRPALPDGEAGLILAKGPQVMKGYYKNKEATDKAVDKFGWFDTGDLGRVNPATGDLILTGRAKDTIVLSNGENIEPVPIEDAIMGETPLIDQVMLTGQDGRFLVAITVLNPAELANMGFIDKAKAKTLEKACEKVNDPKCTEEECAKQCDILNEAIVPLRSNAQLKKEISAIFRTATTNFRQWEKVSEFHMTLEPFAMANGQLTQSYKVKRAQVTERYEGEL